MEYLQRSFFFSDNFHLIYLCIPLTFQRVEQITIENFGQMESGPDQTCSLIPTRKEFDTQILEMSFSIFSINHLSPNSNKQYSSFSTFTGRENEGIITRDEFS